MADLHELFFVAAHPLRAIEAKGIQGMVGAELRQPPPGTTIEGFTAMPLNKADEALRGTNGHGNVIIFDASRVIGGITPQSWSRADRERIANNQRPLGNHNL